MSRVLILTVVVAGLLGLAQEARAKEIEKIVACGSSGCRTLANGPELELLAEVGSPTEPPRPSAFFSLEIVAGEGGDDSMTLYVPSKARLASRPDNGRLRWWTVPPKSAAAYREAIHGLRPFPASRLTGAKQVARTLAADASEPWLERIFPGALILLGCVSVVVFALKREQRQRRTSLSGSA
jgi:hypothetical protein